MLTAETSKRLLSHEKADSFGTVPDANAHVAVVNGQGVPVENLEQTGTLTGYAGGVDGSVATAEGGGGPASTSLEDRLTELELTILSPPPTTPLSRRWRNACGGRVCAAKAVR